MTARTAPSPSSTPASTPPRPRSAAGSPRVPTSSPAAWATRTWPRPAPRARPPAAPAEPAAAAAPAAPPIPSWPTPLAGHGTPVAGVIAQFVPAGDHRPVDIFSPFTRRRASRSSDQFDDRRHRRRRHRRRRRHGRQRRYGSSPTTTVPRARRSTTASSTWSSTRSSTTRSAPGKVDRVIAAVVRLRHHLHLRRPRPQAYKNYPQLVIALKNEYHKLRKEGIANDRGHR